MFQLLWKGSGRGGMKNEFRVNLREKGEKKHTSTAPRRRRAVRRNVFRPFSRGGKSDEKTTGGRAGVRRGTRGAGD